MAVYAFMLVFVLVAAGGLALFLSNLFESRISRPLLQLAEVARVISEEQDYSVRAVKTSADEFGTLTDAFNAMLAQIDEGDLALRESEARERAQASELRAIMEAVPALIWIARDQGRLITGNRAADEFVRPPLEANASGSGPEASRPKSFEVLVEGRVLPPEEMPVQRAARGIEVQNLEEEVRFNDGTTRFLLGNATPLRDARGEICGAVDLSGLGKH